MYQPPVVTGAGKDHKFNCYLYSSQESKRSMNHISQEIMPSTGPGMVKYELISIERVVQGISLHKIAEAEDDHILLFFSSYFSRKTERSMRY